MTCIRRDHYPSSESHITRDPHHHCAGRVEVIDGRTVVVDPTLCVRPDGSTFNAYGEPGYTSDYDRYLDAHPEANEWS